MGATYSSNQEQEYQSQIDSQLKIIQLQQNQINQLIQTLKYNNDISLQSTLESLKKTNFLQKKQYIENLSKLNQYKQLNKNNESQTKGKKININPYEILNINKNYTKTDLKKAYLREALKHHPDRGGSPNQFKKISISYKYLEKLLEKNEYRDHNQLKNSLKKNEFNEQKKMNKDDFNINKFNKIYQEHKIEDIYDRGYGDWLQSEKINTTSNNFNGKFNKSMFNKEFESMKLHTSKKKSNKLNVLEPTQTISYKNSDSIVELGKKQVKNFSGESGKLCYRDLKDAYENTTLIDVNSVDLSKRNNNVTSLKVERKNVNFTMSPEDTRNKAIAQHKLQEQEKERLQRIRETDQMIFSKYKNIHNRLHS
jgi:curved DNA-binding protein CbpA